MIIKKLKRTSFKKSKAVMISGLVDYILAEHDDRGKDKLAYAGSRNFLTTTVTAQKREMISLAEESIQSRMPVTHWILSWQENEQPSREQVDEAIRLFLRGMGLAEHQTLYALHKNTGNYHLHIVVDRTHPYREKVIQPHRGFDIDAAHKIIAEIEHKQGWSPQINARYRVNEQGYVVKNLRHRAQVKPKPKVEDFENATGEKSAQRIAQERGHAVIQNASCWEELHAGLDAVGLRFVRKGSGAVIFVGDTAVKASSVDRNFSMSRLSKRLGEFKPGYYSERTFSKPALEPASHVCREEWERRRQEEEKHNFREKREKEREELERRQRERREAATARLARHGLSVLNIARHFLKEREQEERAEMRNRPAATEQAGRLPRFKYWLGKRNPYLANLWRFRKRIVPGVEVRKREFPRDGTLASPYAAYRELVKKRFPEKMDESRLDAAIALYMRCAGYTVQEVVNELYRHTPARPHGQNRDDRIDYSRRVGWYAFGTAGDIDIANIQPTQKQIEKITEEIQQINQKERISSTYRLR
ncbi:MAG: relaxase/mobilization nuclease domain-containing protein [Desulfovibrio sp.]|uniref:relaxase/mobilization nuclease domain-containing protein n=1 Tax=Desulfovibrio sp. TaxID=885 RepID=UPI0025BAFB1E|nr:relaxase/mobilization nuclease domain-containing protein [Desulfovibrio sp.]MBS6828730.1 relaxase/mobilization nuclease domain-containing protein [Desulfovibrio sp.]